MSLELESKGEEPLEAMLTRSTSNQLIGALEVSRILLNSLDIIEPPVAIMTAASVSSNDPRKPTPTDCLTAILDRRPHLRGLSESDAKILKFAITIIPLVNIEFIRRRSRKYPSFYSWPGEFHRQNWEDKDPSTRKIDVLELASEVRS